MQNDGNAKYWGVPGEIMMLPKGKGKGIMISEFLTHCGGRLKMPDEVDLALAIATTLPRHQNHINSLKREGIIVVGYAGSLQGSRRIA